MPFQKGKAKTGGRKKQPKLKESVAETLERLGCDPIEGMADIADKTKSEQLRFRCLAELAQYLHPKRRSVEMSGIDGNPIEVTINAREQLLSRIASLTPRKP